MHAIIFVRFQLFHPQGAAYVRASCDARKGRRGFGKAHAAYLKPTRRADANGVGGAGSSNNAAAAAAEDGMISGLPGAASCKGAWSFEMESRMVGGAIAWNSPLRIRHVASGKYLSVAQASGSASGLFGDSDDDADGDGDGIGAGDDDGEGGMDRDAEAKYNDGNYRDESGRGRRPRSISRAERAEREQWFLCELVDGRTLDGTHPAAVIAAARARFYLQTNEATTGRTLPRLDENASVAVRIEHRWEPLLEDSHPASDLDAAVASELATHIDDTKSDAQLPHIPSTSTEDCSGGVGGEGGGGTGGGSSDAGGGNGVSSGASSRSGGVSGRWKLAAAVAAQTPTSPTARGTPTPLPTPTPTKTATAQSLWLHDTGELKLKALGAANDELSRQLVFSTLRHTTDVFSLVPLDDQTDAHIDRVLSSISVAKLYTILISNSSEPLPGNHKQVFDELAMLLRIIRICAVPGAMADGSVGAGGNDDDVNDVEKWYKCAANMLPAEFAAMDAFTSYAASDHGQRLCRESKLMDACFDMTLAPYWRTFPEPPFLAGSIRREMQPICVISKFAYVALQVRRTLTGRRVSL